MKKLIHVFVAFAMVFLGCVGAPETIEEMQSEAPASNESEKQMPPLVPVGPAPGAPFTSINCPDDGASVAAADVRRVASALLANDEFITDRITQKIDAAVSPSGGGTWSISDPNTWTPGNAWQTVPASTNNVDVISKTVDTAENDWFQVTAQFEAITLGTIAVDDGLARLTEDGGEFGQRVRISTVPLPISITAFVQAGAAGTKTFTLRINASAAVYMTGPARLDIVNLGKTKDTP